MTKMQIITERDGLITSNNWQRDHGGRWVKVFRAENLEKFYLHAGYEGWPADYRECHETINDLLTSMSKIEPDKRRWVSLTD